MSYYLSQTTQTDAKFMTSLIIDTMKHSQELWPTVLPLWFELYVVVHKLEKG